MLGPAIGVAELTEERGALDCVTCSAAARRLYVESSYQFAALRAVRPVPAARDAISAQEDGATGLDVDNSAGEESDSPDDVRYTVTPGVVAL